MGWMNVEQTMATMGGMIDVISAVSSVQRSPSRTTPVSRAVTSDGVFASCHRPAAAPPRLGGRPLAMSKPFYSACDHMLGLTCQRLGSIGQTGTTVHRDGSMASADRPSRRSGPRIGEDGTRYCRRFFPVYELLFTLRRTQG